MQNRLTSGNLFTIMLKFSIPFLIASFLQTFYGLADLFITGQFNGAATITAVSIGSQVMHMMTVVVVGLATGSMVLISRNVGAGKPRDVARAIGNSVTLFVIAAVILTFLMLLLTDPVIRLLQAPEEAVAETRRYLQICFAGVPFIVAYNVISSIFRGLGDSRSPMYFVAIAGVINIFLDYLLIGPLGMGAAGAALATVTSQALSVCFALFALRRSLRDIHISRADLRFHQDIALTILQVGLPIALQEGLIQISFLVITAIANTRGVDVAAAVGIVEKVISFLFLVHSAMLSTVSTISAQNNGAGEHGRSLQCLKIGIRVCASFGAVIFVLCQIFPEEIVGLFDHDDPTVVTLGAQYLRSYALDCILAGIHFVFSGYFSAYGKSIYSFIHNMISVVLIRVPGAWLATVLFPSTLLPLGLAAPMGSLLSVLICIFLFFKGKKAFGLA